MIQYKTRGISTYANFDVDMFYVADDPTQVVFAFNHPLAPEEIRWVFDRSLLKEVLNDGTSGQGDILFTGFEHSVIMTFGPNENERVGVTFVRECIEEFVELIYEEVSEEAEHVEITDEEIYKWLEEAN